MFYFKTVALSQYTPAQLEMALRKASLKRTQPLDFVPSRMDIGTDKFFLGYEGKKHPTFTRIRPFIESMLPKFIIKPAVINCNCVYQLRLSSMAFITYLLFSVLLPAIFISAANGNAYWKSAFGYTCFFGFLWLLFFVELKLIDRKIKKALKKFVVQQPVVEVL